MAKGVGDNVRASGVRFHLMTAAGAEALGPALAEIDPWARCGYTPALLTAYLAGRETDAPRFEIRVDRALAGAIGVRRNWLRGPYLQFLGILPAFQKRGTGSTALAWFEGEARASNAQNLWVAASDFNTRALAFYETRGFGRVATLSDLVVKGGSEVLLRKQLTAG
jgi:GNAT superfamily N-acetyltransferase